MRFDAGQRLLMSFTNIVEGRSTSVVDKLHRAIGSALLLQASGDK